MFWSGPQTCVEQNLIAAQSVFCVSTGPITILHVEDDPNDALLFQHACRKAGTTMRLESVADGEDALAYLRGSDDFADREKHPLPSLVLLDLKMSRLNGFDVLAWMRKEERFRRVPVVVLSSSNHDVDIKRAYDLGANSYLVKPVNFDALVEMAKALQNYWLNLNARAG